MSESGPPIACGYQCRSYSEALGMASRLLRLPGCGGHLLIRDIGTTGLQDACGAYPVFSCLEPDRLGDDIRALDDGLVSVTLVADPLLNWRSGSLERVFPVVRPLGDHFVVDLQVGSFLPSSHHRRALRKAAAHSTEIRIDADPVTFATEWTGLYQVLIAHAGITGLRRFSEPIFSRMLAVPGTVMFTAWDRDTLLGADWYYDDGERVYAHLSAYSEAGYVRAVSYPMMDAALRHFAACGARVLDLGGVPVVEGGGRGLAQFKVGWSTRRLPTLLCGRMLNGAEYVRLSAGESPTADDYFPIYRRGEFG